MLRSVTAYFIQEAIIRLRVPQTTASCAVILLRKFISSSNQSHYNIPSLLIAQTCIFLASKVMETPMRVRDVINVTLRMIHPDRPPLEIDLEYKKLKDSMVAHEQIILRQLGFEMRVELPYKYLLNYLHILGIHRKDFAQLCWSFVNDVFFWQIYAQTQPLRRLHVLLFFFASICLKEPITVNKNSNNSSNNSITNSNSNICVFPFWKVFGVSDFQAIQDIITTLTTFYDSVTQFSWTEIETKKVVDLVISNHW